MFLVTFCKKSQKANNFGLAMKRIVKELKPFYLKAAIGIFFAVLGSIVAIVVPNKLADLTNEISLGLATGLNFDMITSIAITVACLEIGSLASEIIEEFMMTDVANNFARELRKRISVKINKLPLRFFDKHQTGDMLSRVTNDVDLISQTLTQSLSTLVASVALLVGVILMMFITNGVMAITAIISGNGPGQKT